MPEPENPPQPQGILKTLIEAFNKLPPLLSFGGLILVTAFVFVYFIGDFPVFLLVVPLGAIVAFLLYAFMERRFELQERKAEHTYDLNKQAQELRHAEEIARLQRSESGQQQEGARPVDGDEDVTPEEWERRYSESVISLCGYPPSMALVDIKEAGMGGHKLALERIFTSLDVPAQEEGRELSRQAPERAQWEQEEGARREAALAAIGRPQNTRLVLLGAPGSGKSTLVNYLALCLAGDRLGSKQINQEHLRKYGWELSHLRLRPVRVILREYAARGLSKGQDIWEFIAADLARPGVKLGGYAPHLKELLEEKGGILLLDGLDEVDKATQVREDLKTNIELFARDYPRVRMVVTSRPYAYGSGWELDDFQVTRLLSFSDEQIQFFIEQWYAVMGQQDRTLGPEKAAAYSESLVRQTERIHNLQDMARHPLLLTMMVYIHRGREGGALPQRREELYRLCVILLLDLWRRSKTIPGRETQTLAEVLGMDTERLQEALAEVAFVAHRDQAEQEQTADIPGSLVAGTLFKYKSREVDVNLDNIIEYVRDRAGLLEDHGRNADDTDDVYRFPHRTFQEYLAARHLLGDANFPNEMVARAREDPTRWRESVLLAAAAALPVMRWSLVEALYERKRAPNTDTEADGADWWGVFLAGQILEENDMYLDPPSRYQDTLLQIQGWHKVIVARGALPPRDRALAGLLLSRLGDDRPGVATMVHKGQKIPDISWGEIVPAGKYTVGGDSQAYQSFKEQTITIHQRYQLARYPVTHAQFQCFVEAGDYPDPRWWEDMPEEEEAYGRLYRLRELSAQWFPYDNHPRESVSWYQAIAFCRWLGDKLGEEIDLPHEYEWEVAARYPHNHPYPWGEVFDAGRANTKESGIGQTTVVGMFPGGANPTLGLHDLSGNVWEWCRNKYGDPEDTTVDDSGDRRTLRGGSWIAALDFARAASRSYDFPNFRYLYYGFRLLVRRPPSQ